MESAAGLPNTLLKILLVCGIFSATLNAGTDIIAGLLKPGYRMDSQSASLLWAFGSSTRPFVLPLNLLAGFLLIAFAVGVWFSADHNWALRITAGLLVGNAICSLLAIAFFPLHANDTFDTTANKIHLILMMTAVILLFLAICFGIFGNHNWFRWFSAGIIVLFILLTILGIWVFPHMTSGQPVSRAGLQERTMIYSEMIWLALQAIVLLRII